MGRTADHPIEPIFLDRWSPRSFSGEPVPDAVLASAFEAARWAPSAFNAQPWRFLVARPDTPDWVDFVSLLAPFNERWAAQASALIVIVSADSAQRRGAVIPNVTHSFDAGAAWANFAHQALLLGWHTHGIGGFDRDAARSLLGIPDDFTVESMVALGRRAGLDALHADFHPQEQPNGRNSIDHFVFGGRFETPLFSKERNAA